MKTVLVTGAYGYLGRHTALKFTQNGYEVYACGHGNWAESEYKKFGIEHWLEGDVDIALLKEFKLQPDVIVHCAGSGSVGNSLLDPVADYNKTVPGTLAILEFIRLISPKTKLIYPSSAAVYGEQKDAPISTSEPLKPTSPYGLHKKFTEELCYSYYRHFNVSTAIIRFFSIYGPGLKKQLLWDACKKMMQNRSVYEFWGKGDETRDWLYISDATELIYLNANNSENYTIFNGGAGERKTIKETLSILAKELCKRNTDIQFNGIIRKGDPKYYHADMNDALGIGWRANVDIETGIKMYTEWFMSKYSD